MLDLPEEYGLRLAKPITTPVDYNQKLSRAKEEESLQDGTIYKQLVGKLVNLTFTRSNIAYALHMLS